MLPVGLWAEIFKHLPAKPSDVAQTGLRRTRCRRADHLSVPAAEVSWEFIKAVKKFTGSYNSNEKTDHSLPAKPLVEQPYF